MALSSIPGYKSWEGMKQRCNNPNNSAYDRYGGRGIYYCARWESFENFIADMGPRPPGLTLDRIDNDGPYEPSNCRWATQKEQDSNKRSNRWITAWGHKRTITDWAERSGIDRGVILGRIKRGWSPEEAMIRAGRLGVWPDD